MSELNVTLIENEADSTAVQLNRKATHGSIVDLQKDGTTLGSITTRAGDVIQISSAGTNAGLDFAGGINPVYSGSLSDNQVDLGYSAYRFKNLYLSGGAYLGGTGAANYLDDYEEGTWTPAPYGGSWSGDNVTGHYVKIGRLVNVIVDIRNVSIDSTASTHNRITNLPFTNGNKRSATSNVVYYNTFDDVNTAGYIEASTTEITFLEVRASASWVGSNFRNTSNCYIQLALTYYTDY